VLDIMPFYYLFLPTWFVSIAAYILLAKRFGAAQQYPEAEESERAFQARVQAFHAEQAQQENHVPIKDTSLLSKLIKATWIIVGLLIPFILAWRVLFFSPDLNAYHLNREMFYDIAIWCR
jgi:hypothetical protein